MLDKIFIIDFEDSFTYNIANILFPYEKNIRVISHQEFIHSQFLEEFFSDDYQRAVILGPGPGRPEQYEHYFSTIKNIMNDKNIYTMGICLGHQMMGKIEGKTISKSHTQMHGQTVVVEFKGVKATVQRYNSLAVFEDGGETDICYYKNGVSYQFHPESIGTHDNDIFFKDLLSFIQKK